MIGPREWLQIELPPEIGIKKCRVIEALSLTADDRLMMLQLSSLHPLVVP